MTSTDTAALLRATDWSSTAVGPMEQWPQSLRLAVAICLSSRFPMFVWWGPQLVNIYNDAYIPILGKRHPKAFGRPARESWEEIWPVIGPQAEAVMNRGEATWNERVLLVMERHGYTEDTWFTWSYSPIRDETGHTSGLFCACKEETATVVAERERDRLLERVETERARLAEAFAQSPAFLAIVRGPDHVFEFVNEGYYQLIGRRDIVGRPVREALPELMGQGFFELLDRVYTTGQPFVGRDTRVMVPRQEQLQALYLDFVYQPMRGPDGAVAGVLAHGIDVTDKTRAEARDRLLLAIDETVHSLSDPEQITAVATRLLVAHLDVDRSAYADVRADEDTVDRLGAYTRGDANFVLQGRLSDYGALFPHLLRQNQPFVVNDVETHQPPPGDLAAYRQAGTRAFISVPLLKAGRLVAALGVSQRAPRVWTPDEVELVRQVAGRCWESIERARVERTLRESEARFRHLADALASEKKVLELIVTGSPVADLLDAIVRGVESQSSDGMICSVLMLDESGQRLQHGAAPSLPAAYNEAIDGLPIGPSAGSCGTAAFQRRAVFVTDIASDPLWANYRGLAAEHGLAACCSTPIVSSEGTVLGTVAMYYRRPHQPGAHDAELILSATHLAGIVLERDLADRRLRHSLEAEQVARTEAERANRMKDEFLATLSHELRTPLNSILGWTRILQLKPDLPRDVLQGVDVIDRNARAQATLMQDLLDMSAIVSGKVRLNVQPLDLAALVQASVDTAMPAAQAKHIGIETLLDGQGDAVVVGDGSRLQQVFWNLLSNAVKFTPKEGRIEVAVERLGSDVEVRVSDNGPGIAPEFLPYVFDRFRQAEASTARRHGGLGLGLSIVKQLVELHGGTVRVASEGEGRGASFVVALPVAAVRPEADAGLARDEDLAGLRILVVDDDADARDMVRRLLEDRGADVSAAGSAAEALKVIAAQRFHVLISDIGMPDQDGHALIRRVRSLEPAAGGDVPALALTAYARPEDRAKAMRSGFQGHIAKPVDPPALFEAVVRLARRT